MLKTVRIIMLDWGGTLAGVERQDATRESCARAVVEMLVAAGHPLPDDADTVLASRLRAGCAEIESGSTLTELDSGGLLEAWAGGLGCPLPDDAFRARLVEALWKPWVGCLELFEGVARALGRLRNAGFVLGLVSNCAAHPACCRAELERQGIADLLAFTVFSSELGVRKPHVAMYREALARAGRFVGDEVRPAEVLFVGDTPEADHVGPKRLGMRTALVRTGHWRGNMADLAELPDLCVDCVVDLCDEEMLVARGVHPTTAPQ